MIEVNPSETVSKGHRTRARIIDAAVSRFGSLGLRSTSVAAVARDAGVSPATVFSYWKTKEDLFDAALDHDARTVIEDLFASILRGDVAESGVPRLEPAEWGALVDVLLDVLEGHPLSRRVLAGEEPDALDGVLDLGGLLDLRTRLADAIRADQTSGACRPDLDADLTAVGMETIIVSLVLLALQLQSRPDDLRRQGVAEVLTAAFRSST